MWMKLLPEYQKGLDYLKQGYSNHGSVGIDKDEKTGLKSNGKRRGDIVLIFGGRNEGGLLPADLVQCTLARNKVVFEKAATKGQPPCARYNHSLTHLPRLNALAVFGGQGVDIELSPDAAHIHVLSLASLDWFSCKARSIQGLPFENRYCHGVANLKDTLVIFGGINAGGFAPSTVDVIRLVENANFNDLEEDDRVDAVSDHSHLKPKVQKKTQRSSLEASSSQQKLISISKVVREPYIARTFQAAPIDNSATQLLKSTQNPKKKAGAWSRIKLDTISSKLEASVDLNMKKRATSLKKIT
jgi:hypothetical protein